MPADQAAGLRRRGGQQPLRCIQVFSRAPATGEKLARALHARGWTLLLVDAVGRILNGVSTRSLFDWRCQVERGQLHLLPRSYGDGWSAPGIRTQEPALAAAARRYDAVVFDAGPGGVQLAVMPGAVHGAVVELQPTRESVRWGYALLKTLFHADAAAVASLVGEPAACAHVRAACARFLGPGQADAIYCAAHEDDAFAELAVRMAHEETGLTARQETGNT